MSRQDAALKSLLRLLEDVPDYAKFAVVVLLKRIEQAAGAAAYAVLCLSPCETGGKPGKQTTDFIDARSMKRRLMMFVGIRLWLLMLVLNFIESIASDRGRDE